MKLRQSKRRQLRMSIDEEKKTISIEEKGICEIVSNLLVKYDNITKQFYEIPLTKDFLNEEYIEYIFSTQRRSSEDVVYLSKYLSTYKNFLNIICCHKNTEDNVELFFKVTKYIKKEELLENQMVFKLGDQGDKFYLIAKGVVSIIIKKESRVHISKKEYIEHLNYLYTHNERELLLLTITSNAIFNVKWDIPEHLINNDKKHTDEVITVSSIDDYVKSVYPHITPNQNDTEELSIWIYFNVCDLKTGQTFGDVALSSNITKRTATIICKEDTTFYSLSKRVYETSLKEANEKIRKNKIQTKTSVKEDEMVF